MLSMRSLMRLQMESTSTTLGCHFSRMRSMMLDKSMRSLLELHGKEDSREVVKLP